jgi:hypothetical protein
MLWTFGFNKMGPLTSSRIAVTFLGPHDLAPCNFFPCGHLKAEVYKHRPHTLDELKTAIPPDMTAKVMNNLRKRLDVCIRSQGRHMDDIVFHK